MSTHWRNNRNSHWRQTAQRQAEQNLPRFRASLSHPSGRWLVPALLGASLVLAFAPFKQFWLAWPILAFAAWHWRTAPTWQAAAWRGFVFGAGFFLAGVSWVYVSLSVFGGMPMPVALIATVGFCLLLAAFPAAIAGIYRRWLPDNAWIQAIFFAALWAFADWCRSWVFTGFPWLALGYAHSPPSPLAGFAPILGVFGLSFISALQGALLLLARRGAILVCIFIVLGFALRFYAWTEPTGEGISVALVQGNVPQSLKWEPEQFSQTLNSYSNLLAKHPAQLSVLPETALPAFFDELPHDYIGFLKEHARLHNGNVIVGSLHRQGKDYWNSAVSLGRDPQQLYFKSHLVPFGEFIPFGFGLIMKLANIPMSDFTAGDTKQKVMHLNGINVAVNICYEDVFGDALIHNLPEANVLVNLSNTAWFGKSLAQAQHLQIAQLRALETGRPMLRATNTGMTAVITPNGVVEAVLPAFTTDVLMHTIHAYQGKTPFSQRGNTTILLLLALCFLWIFLRK